MALLAPLCPGCVDRDREIAKLKDRIADLEAQSQRLRQQVDELKRTEGRQAARFRRRKLKGRNRLSALL